MIVTSIHLRFTFLPFFDFLHSREDPQISKKDSKEYQAFQASAQEARCVASALQQQVSLSVFKSRCGHAFCVLTSYFCQ